MSHIRLNKYLAQLGVASRRKIDEITIGHRITINGRLAIPGDKVNPETDTVIVDKKIIKPQPQKLVYYALNKPKFVLSTNLDDRGRQTILSFVPKTPRVYPVGRLDFESTGLILLTNDGDLALRLTHPRFHLPKVYLLTILGKVPVNKIAQLEKGIRLEDGLTAPAKAEVMPSRLDQTIIKLTLYQGKKRQIRRMCAAIHVHLIELHRISIGPIEINDLAPGKYRELSNKELSSIRP
jgi:pseudouridine synthase